MRTVTSFNSDWLFAPRDLDLDAPDSAFEQVTLPHTNHLLAHRSADESTYQFQSTYRKRFHLPEPLANRQVFLDFDGAMLVSTVCLNGQQVGVHQGGYTPFSFEITSFLKEGENVLTVLLDSTERPEVPPNGRLLDYLPFGGIYRSVHLRMVEPCHITAVFARPQGVPDTAHLECDIHVSGFQPGLTAEAVLLTRDREPVAVAHGDITTSPLTLSLSDLDHIDPWTLDDPALYTLEVRLLDGETLLDSLDVRVGFRSAEFRKDGAFYLNDRPVKLFGLNRHQTYPYVGAAAPARLQRQDADILKFELGCNIVRTSHYPQSPEFLDRCDEIGLLVFEEMAGWQHIGDDTWQALALRDLQTMIERDRNHPSIILWGVRLNESPDHTDLYTRTNALAHQLDPTRQTGGVRNFIQSEFLEDVFTLNDFPPGIQTPRFTPHLITEFGGHMLPTKTWDNEDRKVEHALIHARKQDDQWGRADIAGAIGWCAFDYYTHRQFGSGDGVCYHGVMDIFRLPKWAAYFYKSQQHPDRQVVLHPATHWTVGDRSGGGNNPLTIFSNCDEIEVCEGGETLGRFQPDRDQFPHLPHPPFTIRWPLPYNPWGRAFDDLTIIGYIEGRAVIEYKIAADHLPDHLSLAASSPVLNADGSDMTRLAIRLEDRYGNVLPYHARVITFEVQGEVDLIGENPLPLIGGQAACYIRARCVADSVTVTASTAGLPPVSVTLQLER